MTTATFSRSSDDDDDGGVPDGIRVLGVFGGGRERLSVKQSCGWRESVCGVWCVCVVRVMCVVLGV